MEKGFHNIEQFIAFITPGHTAFHERLSIGVYRRGRTREFSPHKEDDLQFRFTAYLVSAVKRRRKDYLIQLYKRSSIESTVEVVYESEPSSEEVVLDRLPLMDVIENGALLEALQKLITNILTRKRELGVLQAVGLSSKQLSKMLLIEGLFYTLGVLLLSISCGTLIGYLLCTVFSAMSIFGKVSYHFPTVEMFSYFILMLAVQMLFSYLAIRQIKKQSLVDQIRELS